MTSRLAAGFGILARRSFGCGSVIASSSRAPALQGFVRPACVARPFMSGPTTLKSATGTDASASKAKPAPAGLADFFDVIPSQTQEGKRAPVGRAWKASELRMKSFDDLHKLWFILQKERNMLLTEKEHARSRGQIFVNGPRMKKVRLSMARIKVVLGERQRLIQAERKAEIERLRVEAA